MSDGVESRFFRRWATLVVRFRWLALALTLLTTLGAGALVATRLQIDNSTEYFAGGSDEDAAALERFRADFGADDLSFVLVEGDVFSLPFLERLRALHDDLERLEVSLDEPRADAPTVEGFEEAADFDAGWGDAAGNRVIEDVTSLVDFPRTTSRHGVLTVRGFLDPWPSAEDLPALRRRALDDPLLRGRLLGSDGRHTVLAVRTLPIEEQDADRVALALAERAATHDAEGFRVQVTGTPIMNQALNAMVVEDMNRLVGLALATMAAVLLAVFRSPVGVIPPLLVVACSATWTLGLMAATGTPLTLLTNILPAFLVVVGLGDAVHLLMVWRDARVAGAEPREALLHAVASTGVPIVFTSVTTAAGLASLVFASSQAIRELGAVGAVGVLAALVNSLVLLPAILSFWTAPPRQARQAANRVPDRLDRVLTTLTGLSAAPKGRAGVLAATAAVCVVSAVGCARLELRHDPLAWFGDDSPITRGFRDMDAHVGGTAPAYVVIDAPGERGVRDLEVLRGMERLEAWVLAWREPERGEAVVTSIASVLDLLRDTNRALHDGSPDAYALPDTQRGVDDALIVFENADRDELHRFVTTDLARARMALRLRWQDATAYAPFRRYLQEGVERHLPDDVEVTTTGTVFHVLTVVDRMVQDLATSFASALLTISALLVLLVRRVRLGLVAMIPNLVPIGVTLGAMGFAGIPLDLNNLLLASIVLGIAVDDTIHYVYQFGAARSQGTTTEASVRYAIGHAGRAIVGTTVVLILGFSVFGASRLISLQRFGLLVAFACLVALLADLVLTPALLRLTDRDSRSAP